MLRGDGSLRDARFLTKFMYLMMDERFYEPYESRYQPSNEYLDIVKDLAAESPGLWLIQQEGFWFHVHPTDPPESEHGDPTPRDVPNQGWKVHVSATLSNALSILKRAAGVALEREVPFKFALDRGILSLMSSKAWARARSGKFLTMYPSDLSSFKDLLEHLYEELRDEEGPYVLSDKRYKDCRVLYYRYGGLTRTSKLDITGQKTLVLISPEGEAIPDVRTPFFAPPPWETDPFPGEESSPPEEPLLNGRYAPKEALAFSNSGGVYLAEDRKTGADVVIKEARAHTLQDGRGNDAIILLKREQSILEELRGTGLAAEPIEGFQIWENYFLAQEFIDGVTVRKILLEQSPLMRANPSLEDSRKYYDVFKKLFTSLLQGLDSLHQKGIIFGDLSATNLKVDPETFAVRFIDFEGAHRSGVDNPTYLFTPTFKSKERTGQETPGIEEDLYAVAALMFYQMFPIAALGLLRDDLFDTVLPTFLTDIGWTNTELLTIIRGLSKNEITCARAVELLEKPVEILPPEYKDDVELESCGDISKELGRFLLDTMRPEDKTTLFPADPIVHPTNPLSLGFGACGVLYALKKCGFEIPQVGWDWVEQELDRVAPEDLAPGLLTGASGIAWCLGELGRDDRAEELMKVANDSPLLKTQHSYLYGMAGVGLANLYFYLRTGKDDHLAVARDLAESLRKSAKENDRGLYWLDSDDPEATEDTEGALQIGFGYGQTGVALFFLRLFELTGNEELWATGKRALEYDLSHATDNESGGIAFPAVTSNPTLLPYLEEGSAGILKVALRYGLWDGVEPIFTSMHRKYSSFAGLLYGLGSFVDVFTDAFLLSGERKYLEMAKRPVTGIRDLYLVPQECGLATPGEGLFRITCDYATGVAGVMRALHRVRHLDAADFVLDELAAKAGEVGGVDETTPSDVERRALVNMT